MGNMKHSFENITAPESIEKKSKSGEKKETREKTRTKEDVTAELMSEHLIVKDGYHWDSSELQEVLPTMFHGTSEYFLENILQNGIKPPTAKDLEAIEKEAPDIAKALREEFKKYYADTISVTTSYAIAESHAQKSPERYYNTASHQFITYKGDDPGHTNKGLKIFGRWNLEDLPRDSETKRLFLSVFNPRGIVLSLRPHKEDIDPELIKKYDPTTNFFIDTGYRKNFLKNIKEMQSWLIQYVEGKRRNKGETTFTIEEVSKMHTILGGKVLGMFKNRKEIEMFTPGEIAEIYFRDHLYEIPIHDIAPNRITGVERVKVPKPQNEKNKKPLSKFSNG